VEGRRVVVQSSGGLVSAILSIARRPEAEELYRNIVWVGTGEGPGAGKPPAGDPEVGATLVPVHIPASVDRKFYGGFCNDVIWPLFHYFGARRSTGIYGPTSRRTRCSETWVARRAWRHLGPRLPLFLLPALLRDAVPSATIGSFLPSRFTFELSDAAADGPTS
jgi:trehalose 6-phosphate synthase/phosphatase